MFRKFKKFLSRAKVAYLTSKDQGKTKEDNITQMLDQFEYLDKIKFTSTSDVPSSDFRGKVGDSESASVVVSTTKQDDGEIVNTPVSDVLAMEPMEKAAKLSRRIQEIRDQQYQFIAIAWIVLPCFCYFLLCPEVLRFDVTSHSKYQQRLHADQVFLYCLFGVKKYIFFYFRFSALFGMSLKGMGGRFLLSKDEPLTPDINGVMTH